MLTGEVPRDVGMLQYFTSKEPPVVKDFYSCEKGMGYGKKFGDVINLILKEKENGELYIHTAGELRQKIHELEYLQNTLID